MAKRAHKYLFLRDQRWHYQRNVPKKFRHIQTRKRIRVALHTNSLQEALQRRDAMVEAENAYWTALAIEASELGGVSQSTSKVQEHHYKAAAARAMSFGYASYKTAHQLLTETRVASSATRALQSKLMVFTCRHSDLLYSPRPIKSKKAA